MSRLALVLIVVSMRGVVRAQAEVVETRLGVWDDARDRTTFTPDGRHIAYVTVRNGACQVICDGKAGPAFRDIGPILLSHDATRLSYAVYDGAKWILAIDGVVHPEYDTTTGEVFSPDGSHFAFAHWTKAGTAIVVVDGQTVGIYDGLGKDGEMSVSDPIAYTPDGRHLTFFASRGDKHFMVIDGKPGPEFGSVNRRVFSADGAHVAFVGWNGKKQVVVDGRAGAAYDTISDSPPVVSPDGSRIAYVAWGEGHWFMVCDGKNGPAFDAAGSATFSSDSRRVAYPALGSGKWKMIVDGAPGPDFDSVGTPRFSPDNSRVAYAARVGKKWLICVDAKAGAQFDSVGPPVFGVEGKHLAYVARTADRSSMVVDGAPREACEGLGDPVFSADGSHLAFAQRRGAGWTVNLDGQAGPEFDDIGPIVFGPKLHRLAYNARRGKKWMVVVDGTPSWEVDGADPAQFSADGGHVVCGAMLGGRITVLLDGSVGPTYDQVIKAKPMFNAAGDVEFLAVREHTLFRVTIRCKG